MVHSPISAQALIGDWIDHCPRRPPQRIVGQVGKLIKEMLGEDIDPADIRRGLAAWKAKGLSPSVLPSVVNEVMNGSRRVSARQAETDELFDRAMQRARARDAARGELL